MKNLATSFLTLAGVAFLATNAIAEDNSATANVFNADISNPDLAAVITSFQDVCLPFIVHTTELPQNLNMKHYDALLTEADYDFQSRATASNRYMVEPAREPWKPSVEEIYLRALQNGDVNTTTRRKFTVFDGVSNVVVESMETITDRTGEIFGVVIPAKYKIVTRAIDDYSPKQNKHQTVSLGWNYGSPSAPAKSCAVRLSESSISSEDFDDDFIKKDADWQPMTGKTGTWSQCTIDGADEFEFTAERKDGKLSLSVKRNDFFEPNLCTKG